MPSVPRAVIISTREEFLPPTNGPSLRDKFSKLRTNGPSASMPFMVFDVCSF